MYFTIVQLNPDGKFLSEILDLYLGLIKNLQLKKVDSLTKLFQTYFKSFLITRSSTNFQI